MDNKIENSITPAPVKPLIISDEAAPPAASPRPLSIGRYGYAINNVPFKQPQHH